MAPSLSLNSRQRQVLRATIRHYVATAEPVGSKAIAQGYDLQVSPATVRQAMGVLERAGLLYQPHTSAGRIPSDHGYRLYVDELIQPSPAVAQRVDTSLGQLPLNWEWSGWSLEAILRDAAQILAALSGYLTLITPPQDSLPPIRQVRLVPVEAEQVLLVIVLASLETQSMVIPLASLPTDTTAEDLDRELQWVSNFLTARLQGQSLADMATLDWGELGRDFKHYTEALTAATQAIARRLATTHRSQFVMGGLAEVLRQPEFTDALRLQAIVHLLEEDQTQLRPLVCDPPTPSRKGEVQVWIGSENPLEPMQGCALVSAPYHRGGQAVGSISVLGPTRMVYENAIAIVEAAARYLSDSLSERPR